MRYEANCSKWNPQSEMIFLLRYEAIFYCYIKLIFIPIWSEIRYLKQIFRYKEIFSSDIEKSCDIKQNPQSKANFSIWSEFVLRYEAIFSTIWSEFIDLKQGQDTREGGYLVKTPLKRLHEKILQIEHFASDRTEISLQIANYFNSYSGFRLKSRLTPLYLEGQFN